MFRIRVFTPAVVNLEGWRHAGAELVAGSARSCFLLDLSHWGISSYQRQWREGIERLREGAASSALVAAYRGPGEAPHVMWALWREDPHVYMQPQSVLPGEIDAPFDPFHPYAHVGGRIRASELGLPIPEWRFDASDLYAVDLGIRWPS